MVNRRFRKFAVAATAGALLATGVAVVPAQASAGLDRQALRQSLDAVHEAGMYGIYSQVRDGAATWQGAAGVADVKTRRPVTPNMVHRIGSITKTFTSVAVLQQVAKGKVELDAPVGRYLPELLPGERGQQITVRMLLNHTSHIADYIASAFPSLLEPSGKSLDDNRFRTFAASDLAKMGVDAPATGQPGATPGMYSNTNYVLAGLLLEKVTGIPAEQYITRNVIRKAGLRNTSFPRTPFIPGAHSKAYESWYGLIDPPKDYSVYNMSWAGTAGAMVSTLDDLNRFYRALLRGELIGPAELGEMQKTVPVQGVSPTYGLGLYAVDLPCGRFWGHDGAVFGMGTQSLATPDGSRQFSFGINLMKYQRLDDTEPNPIDVANYQHAIQATCGPDAARTAKSAPPSFVPFQTDSFTVKGR
ncbi:serine hydrolase domain-containing protein [Nonomuraea sp. NPDC046802]|uniref:serine hydrolase domain-containing protein n=1 Tax=Nonomuraea sp. NPDC046802 TaxID=3154919 RepID=UPI00340F5BF5